jgi:hypothetical protein
MRIGPLDVTIYRKQNEGIAGGVTDGSTWFKCQGNPFGNETEITVNECYALARELLRAAHRLECSACADATAPAVDRHALLAVQTNELLRDVTRETTKPGEEGT